MSDTLRLKRTEQAIDLSLRVGLRFIERKKRYILQAQVILDSALNELTWIDIPLCPETYGK